MASTAPSIWRIPLFAPDFGPAELEAVQRPVREGWLTMGPLVSQLEASWRLQTGSAHALAVSNGTAALHLAAMAAGLGPGDEVLCPTLTFVATANAVRYLGAEVVFVESTGEDDLNLDPEDCARKITPRTKAIMVVHYAGFPAAMPQLLALARHHGLAIIEDSAHAVFSRAAVDGASQVCGSMGQTGAFSLFSNKNLTCGEGGLITTNDDEIARKVRLWRSHGMTSLTLDRHEGRAVSYDVVELGYNFRLDEIRASLALAQLERLPDFLWARHRLFLAYRERLSGLPVVLPFAHRPEFNLSTPGGGAPGVLDGSASSGILPPIGIHILPILLPEGADRRTVMERLKTRGIQSSIHYPPIHQFEAYRSAAHDASLLPRRTEALSRRQLTLPFYPSMTVDQVDEVVQALGEALA